MILARLGAIASEMLRLSTALLDLVAGIVWAWFVLIPIGYIIGLPDCCSAADSRATPLAILGVALAMIGVLALLAWLSLASSWYLLTDRRTPGRSTLTGFNVVMAVLLAMIALGLDNELRRNLPRDLAIVAAVSYALSALYLRPRRAMNDTRSQPSRPGE